MQYEGVFNWTRSVVKCFQNRQIEDYTVGS